MVNCPKYAVQDLYMGHVNNHTLAQSISARSAKCGNNIFSSINEETICCQPMKMHSTV